MVNTLRSSGIRVDESGTSGSSRHIGHLARAEDRAMLRSNLSADSWGRKPRRDVRLRASLRVCDCLGIGINAKNSQRSLAHHSKRRCPHETRKHLTLRGNGGESSADVLNAALTARRAPAPRAGRRDVHPGGVAPRDRRRTRVDSPRSAAVTSPSRYGNGRREVQRGLRDVQTA